MHHGTALHASSLTVGMVVRAIAGGLVRIPGAPALIYIGKDGLSTDISRVAESTRGWRNPPVGGVDDFRQGFDAMTVYKVTDEYVSFVRPYLHVNADGTLGACGIEHVDNVARGTGHWYEVL